MSGGLGSVRTTKLRTKFQGRTTRLFQLPFSCPRVSSGQERSDRSFQVLNSQVSTSTSPSRSLVSNVSTCTTVFQHLYLHWSFIYQPVVWFSSTTSMLVYFTSSFAAHENKWNAVQPQSRNMNLYARGFGSCSRSVRLKWYVRPCFNNSSIGQSCCITHTAHMYF